MKSIVLIVGCTGAINMNGINKDKMHNYEAVNGDTNWRKPWPQGIDQSDGDAEVLEMFNKPEPTPRAPGEHLEHYPWQYDKDVIDTGKSIDSAESMTNGNLTFDSVAVH